MSNELVNKFEEKEKPEYLLKGKVLIEDTKDNYLIFLGNPIYSKVNSVYEVFLFN